MFPIFFSNHAPNFSNELSQSQDLPIDRTETEPIRVDLGSPNVNNAVSPDADNGFCFNYFYLIIAFWMIVGLIIILIVILIIFVK